MHLGLGAMQSIKPLSAVRFAGSRILRAVRSGQSEKFMVTGIWTGYTKLPSHNTARHTLIREGVEHWRGLPQGAFAQNLAIFWEKDPGKDGEKNGPANGNIE